MTKNSGFTLIEMMIGMSIIGILASVAIPSFSKYKDHVRDAEADMMIAAMARGAKAYYTEEFQTNSSVAATSHSNCFPNAGPAPFNSTLGGEIGGMIPTAIPGSKQYIDFDSFDNFVALGLSGSGFYFHTFVMGGGGGCMDGSVAEHAYVAPMLAIRINKLPNPSDPTSATLSIGAIQLYQANGGLMTNGGIIWFKDMGVADFITTLTGFFEGAAQH